MNIDSGTAAILTIAGTQGIQLFTALCPDRNDLREASPDDTAMKDDLRHGEVMSIVLTMGLSGLLTYLTKNVAALWIGAACCITMTTAYEVTRQRSAA